MADGAISMCSECLAANRIKEDHTYSCFCMKISWTKQEWPRAAA